MKDALCSRRDFVAATALLGPTALFPSPCMAATEPALETTRIRLPRFPHDVVCVAPMWVANELLRAEGFTDIQYVSTPTAKPALVAGAIDFTINDIFSHLLQINEGIPLVLLGGVHTGCFELFASEHVKSVRDLLGKTVSASNLGRRAFVEAMVAYVGLNPRSDVTFVSHPATEGIQLLAEGKIDAVLGFPPEPQELRARKIGHSIVNTATDRPWSQYFCCFAAGHRDFVTKYPVATKSVLRAFLKAANLCALEPESVARFLVDRGYIRHYEYAAQALKEIPYNRWRELDSADTVRYFALRLHETGVIKASPQKLLAQGTDWRFIDQLKRELKA